MSRDGDSTTSLGSLFQSGSLQKMVPDRRTSPHSFVWMAERRVKTTRVQFGQNCVLRVVDKLEGILSGETNSPNWGTKEKKIACTHQGLRSCKAV